MGTGIVERLWLRHNELQIGSQAENGDRLAKGCQHRHGSQQMTDELTIKAIKAWNARPRAVYEDIRVTPITNCAFQ